LSGSSTGRPLARSRSFALGRSPADAAAIGQDDMHRLDQLG
jgi:hypothetical protein